ncbi:MAG TPA: hypothetical protein PK677_05325 [Acidiphilium sp.]|nr:MAG: hypothetical protein B7Z67_05245 [Acidiphilium sp. 21-60-14]OYV92528.1 MAG: hypothetical protein B7Z57_00410 [Acidiphilium sp. 37-60-79]OZB40979.1 MAG: hypothetical protein B7X48_02735 [Acidiphilium sp. 34-60-192]HQT87959.1 hypothetical protein [Acidiphilium sp.]HQU22731.1 hypothetical protein [Acidiphilium sp.]
MADLALTYGGDLAFGAAGDLAMASGIALTEQRVLRRLLTNPGDYLWQLSYGGGLGAFVGVAGMASRIAANARAQLQLESRVAQSPAPVIQSVDNPTSGVLLSVIYADAASGQSQVLSLPV